MPETIHCDFCNAPDPAWEYPVDGDIETTSPISGRVLDYSDDPWLACDDCAHMIDEDRWGDLVERTTELGVQPDEVELGTQRAQVARGAIRMQKAELYAAIATRHGPRRPASPS